MLKMIGIMAMALMILTDSTIALEASGKVSPHDEITQKPPNTIYPVFLNLNEASKVGNNTSKPNNNLCSTDIYIA